MKKSNSQIKLTWNVGFTLRIPAPKLHIVSLTGPLVTAVVLLSLALGLVPLYALLLAG